MTDNVIIDNVSSGMCHIGKLGHLLCATGPTVHHKLILSLEIAYEITGAF